MVRTIHNNTKAAVQASQVVGFLMVKMEFGAGASIFVNQTSQKFDYDGDTYLGVGGLGSINSVEEGTDLQNRPLNMEISGIDPTYLGAALNINYQNKPVTIYFVTLDENDAFIGDPVITFKGKIDTMSVQIEDNARISVRCTSDLADWERPADGRYTNVDQQSRFADDKGLEFTAQTSEKEIFFGRKTT